MDPFPLPRNAARIAALILVSFSLVACGNPELTDSTRALPPTPTPAPDGWDVPFACRATPDRLSRGSHYYFENYTANGAPGFTPEFAGCWRNYHATYDGMSDADFTASFVSTPTNGRKLEIAYQSVLSTNATVDYRPHSAPATGWDSGQLPDHTDLLYQPQCYGDVSVVMPVKPLLAGNAPLYGLLLDAKMVGKGTNRRITGYLIHVNGGGNSVTIARFKNAIDHAFDFIDAFPGSFGAPNPTSDGPYKGWDFHAFNTVPPAGGTPNLDAEVTLAAHYHYDAATGDVTLSWEVRPANGIDGSPGSYDFSRTLSGQDALAPGGGYGYYSLNYGAAAPGATAGITVGGFNLTCVNP